MGSHRVEADQARAASRRAVTLLGVRGRTLAVAESLTGGLLAATLVDLPGASAVFRGGVVAYATDLKSSLLGVSSALLAERGAVDPDVAQAMAVGARDRLAADIGLSTTGVAGPDPQDGKAPGTVYIGLAVVDAEPVVRVLTLDGTRSEVRWLTVVAALDLLAQVLDGPNR